MFDGKVYGFVGPIGGGKSFQLNELRIKSSNEKRSFISGDFSDGIRDFVVKIFGAETGKLSPLFESYAEWKEKEFEIQFPCICCGRMRSFSFKGRDLLKNVGEYMKDFNGDDVWARWTYRDIYEKYNKLSNIELKENCNIAFGSIRFGSELKAVFDFARSVNKKVQIVFCNYNKKEYEQNCHVSESLANTLISMGYKDGDIITDVLESLLKNGI